jgi:hypothetical protein
MQRNVFLMFAALVYVIFGLGLLFMPEFVANLYGTSLNVGGLTVTRLFGGALVGLAFICWSIRDAGDSDTLVAVFRGAAIYNVIGLVLSIWYVSAGLWGSFGGSAVILFILLGAGFGYYAAGKR